MLLVYVIVYAAAPVRQLAPYDRDMSGRVDRQTQMPLLALDHLNHDVVVDHHVFPWLSP